jgi:hypothetical protein
MELSLVILLYDDEGAAGLHGDARGRNERTGAFRLGELEAMRRLRKWEMRSRPARLGAQTQLAVAAHRQG